MIHDQKRERRDWTLLIFIIPIGIFLIIIVGQIAIRLMPFWSVNADMNSNLEPDPGSARPFALLEPILPQILTPMAWMESYLTPGADVYYPPFLTFSPTASPPPTEATPTATEAPPTQVTTTSTPSPTSTPAAGTASPTSTPEETEPPDEGDGGSNPPPAEPPTPVLSTMDPSLTQEAPDPRIGIDEPPDSNIGEVDDGTYIVIQLSIEVGPTPDGNYDLVFYEYNNGGSVYLDWIIIGISHFSDGHEYYEVFNWGDQDPDTDSNSNVSDESTDGDGEVDDETIPVTTNPPELYDPNTSDSQPGTGILIDVDTAPSDPPPDTYDFVVIISPPDDPSTNPYEGNAQVDAIQTVEVPIPPTP